MVPACRKLLPACRNRYLISGILLYTNADEINWTKTTLSFFEVEVFNFGERPMLSIKVDDAIKELAKKLKEIDDKMWEYLISNFINEIRKLYFIGSKPNSGR